ncbi:MAG TPA: membrane protein insertion efficiency factor YidD [bacterium]
MLKYPLIGLVRLYQLAISPFIPPCCRFYPSCSHYAIEALERHGALRGLWLTVWRLLRCQPWSAGGYDPVPDAKPHRHHPIASAAEHSAAHFTP